MLDLRLAGLQPGVVTLVAGRPGMGKSALARRITDANSEAGIGVHVFSLEDTRAAYMDRVIGEHASIAADRLRSGQITRRDEMRSVRDAAGRLVKRTHWHVDDRSGIGAREIVRSVRRARRENDTQVVVVDYIQLLTKRPGMKTHEAIGENMNLLADAAKQDGMAYVVVSQLNRECEKRDKKQPRLSDLKECGTLEERSKAVVAVYRPWAYDETQDRDLMQLIVLKNTNGGTGYCDVRWDGPLTRIW